MKTANQRLSSLIRDALLMNDFNKEVIFNSTPLLKGGSIIVPFYGCLPQEL